MTHERDQAKRKWENLKIIRAAYKKERAYKTLKQQHAVVNNYQHVKQCSLHEVTIKQLAKVIEQRLDKLLCWLCWPGETTDVTTI